MKAQMSQSRVRRSRGAKTGVTAKRLVRVWMTNIDEVPDVVFGHNVRNSRRTS